MNLGITHIITWNKVKNIKISQNIKILNLLESTNNINKPEFSHIFKVLDFIRYCIIKNGKICFIDDFQFSFIKEKPNYLIRKLIILCFSFIIKLPAYDIWTYLNSKLLFFYFPIENLNNLSSWINYQYSIEYYLNTYTSFKCLCGACLIILKNQLGNGLKNIKNCSCSGKFEDLEYSDCPSSGCYEYIQIIKVKIYF